jgi:hypothetical protein
VSLRVALVLLLTAQRLSVEERSTLPGVVLRPLVSSRCTPPSQ